MKYRNTLFLTRALALLLVLGICSFNAVWEVSADDSASDPDVSSMTFSSGAESDDPDADIFQTYAVSVDSFSTKNVPIYLMDPENKQEIEVGILNGMDDIPYLSMETIADLINTICGDDSGTFELTLENDGKDGVFVLQRENGAVMAVDFNENTIYFSDIDTFTANNDAVNGLDLIVIGNSGDNTLISHSSTFYKNPNIITIDLDYYGIFPVYQDGVGYLPMQTIADLIVGRIGLYMLFNGESIVVTPGIEEPVSQSNDAAISEEELEEAKAAAEEAGLGDVYEEAIAEQQAAAEEAAADTEITISDIYYSVDAAETSDEMAIFNYNELCMALDYSYGLKDEHEITSFNKLFTQSGLAVRLESTDPDSTYTAIADLCNGYFADVHSQIGARSCFSSADIKSTYTDAYKNFETANNVNLVANTTLFRNMIELMKDFPDGIPGYEEVGDTAYITFNAFHIDKDFDYYSAEPTADTTDTILLISYADQQIKREGSPIQNVVLDLSNNGGGDLDAAVAVISWMVGQARLGIEDTISGAQATCCYNFDANLDGTFDDNDTLYGKGYNLFCLISPYSFSCANLVPAALKQSESVTIIGKASTGGACSVQPISTANGMLFTISSPYRMNTVNNGVYYSIDNGVEPDIRISKDSHFFDREYLTNLIDNLP